VLVITDNLTGATMAVLRNLGIDVLLFDLDERKPRLEELERFKKDY
jgi:hypothetical protein